MQHNLKEIMKSLPKSRRTKIEARAAELIAEEVTAQVLRKTLSKDTRRRG